MTYREPGARRAEPLAEDGPGAVFQVRHRDRSGLFLALLVAIGALAFGIGMLLSPTARTLAPVALLAPAVLFAAAIHRTFDLTGEVVLVVLGLPEKGIVRATLRRRWGLLPWSAPLTFDATSVPSFSTRWDTGFASSKYGRGRSWKRAELVLDVEGSAIPLPAMRGPGRVTGDVVVRDHAQAVKDAIALYDESAASLLMATANGVTLHFERRGPGGSSVSTRPDLLLFGPLGASSPRVLGPNLEFYIKALASPDDATTRYALVDARSGDTLFQDDDQSVVGRFGDRIEGRRVEPPSGAP